MFCEVYVSKETYMCQKRPAYAKRRARTILGGLGFIECRVSEECEHVL